MHHRELPFRRPIVVNILLLLFFARCRNGENQDISVAIDSLGKYSYMAGVYKDSLGQLHLQGITTGFFIRDSDVLYFGSSYHAMTQTVTTGGPVTGLICDYMRVRIEDNGRIGYWLIDLRKIKERGHPTLFTREPDVYFIKCPPELKPIHINSLEEWIRPNEYTPDTATTLLVHGYPNPANLEVPLNLDTYKDSVYSGAVVSPRRYRNIPQFQGIDSLHLVISPVVSNGFSGSPVFYSHLDHASGKNVVEFGGVIDARDTATNYATSIKRKYVLQELGKAKMRP